MIFEKCGVKGCPLIMYLYTFLASIPNLLRIFVCVAIVIKVVGCLITNESSFMLVHNTVIMAFLLVIWK